jgi:hypothetical protein
MRPIRKLSIALAALSALIAIFAATSASALSVPVYQYSGIHFGSEGTGPGQFSVIGGSTSDSAGNFWIVDVGGGRVEKFNSKGEYLSQISTNTSSGSDVAVSPEGSIWVTDAGTESLSEYSPTGTFIRKIGGEFGSGPGQFYHPEEIAISPTTGNIWVVDYGNSRVQEFSSTGAFIKAFGSFGTEHKQFAYITGIAPDSFGGVTVLDDTGGELSRIQYIYSSGEWGPEINPGIGGTLGDAMSSTGASGNQPRMFIADATCSCIKVIASTLLAGQFGGPAPSEGELNEPRAPVFDSSGNPWLVEFSKTMVQKFVPKAPIATTEAASEIGTHGANLNGKVNPEGSATTYQFEYGTSLSYGTKTASTAAGEGASEVAVKQAISGLASNTTYHYRVAATNVGGTTYGSDKTLKTTSAGTTTSQKLESLGVINKFDASTASKADFNSNWLKLPWANEKGVDLAPGWGPEVAYPQSGGTYYNSNVSGTEAGFAAGATLSAAPAATGSSFSLWLDVPSPPTSTKSGYELRMTQPAGAGVYNISLFKWTSGTQKELASKAGVSLATGSSIALVDQVSKVSGWFKTGSEYVNLLQGEDSLYSSGLSGLEANSNHTRLKEFKAGAL